MAEIGRKLHPLYEAGRAQREALGVNGREIARGAGRHDSWISETETRINDGLQLRALIEYAGVHGMEFGVYFALDGHHTSISLYDPDEDVTPSGDEPPSDPSSPVADPAP